MQIWETGEAPATAADPEAAAEPRKLPRSGDPLIDAMIAQVEAGEDVDLDLI